MWKRVFTALIIVFPILVPAVSSSSAWYPDGRLTFDTATSMTSLNGAWCVSVEGSDVAHVVWRDYRDGDWEIYYKRYDGLVWGPDTRLTNSSGFSGNPALAVSDGGVVHVVWDDYRDGNSEIYYKKFDGVTWSADERLTVAGSTSQNPSIAAYGSVLHVVWHDFRDGDFEIYHKEYDGDSWLPDERLTDAMSASMNPSIAVGDDGKVHVVWNDYRDGTSQIYYDEYDGVSWGGNLRLTNTTEPAKYPCIATSAGGGVHVVWSDDRDGDAEIYYIEYSGGWGADERLTTSAGLSQYPSVAAGGSDSIHVVWADKRDGNFEIYYKLRDGMGWGSAERLTDAPGISQYPSIAHAGSSAIHVVWYDGRDGYSEIYWKRTVTDTLPSPIVQSIDPDSGEFGFINHIDAITGQNFVGPARVIIQRAGEPDVYADNAMVVSQESLTCDIDLMLASEGLWDVVVENPDSRRDTLPGAFTVIEAGKPSLASIEPDSGDWGQSVHISNLAGTRLMRGSEVWLWSPEGDSLAATNVIAVTPEQITCDFDLDLGPFGPWDLMLENPDGKRDTLTSGFYVNPLPAPTISSINPGEGLQGTTVAITVLGSRFRFPVSVILEREGYEPVVAENVRGYHVRIYCDLNLQGVERGLWNFVVEIADGQRVEWPAGFLVLGGPEIYSIEPDSAAWGDTVQVDAITGRDFSDPMLVRLEKDGAEDVVASDVTVVSADSMKCTFTLGLAPTGSWDVAVENAVNQVDILAEGFEIVPAQPAVISAVSPDIGYRGFPVHIDSITGEGFMQGASVALQKGGEPDILGTSVVFHSPRLISCDFDLLDVALGSWGVFVRNPDGQQDTLHDGFQVAVAPAPVVSAMSPDSALLGFPVHIDSVIGSNFREAAEVRLQRVGHSDVHATGVTFHSPGLLSCDFDLYGVAKGLWDVVVINRDSQQDTLEGGFRVIALPRPEILSIDPDSGYAGFSVQIDSITGHEFAEPAGVLLQKEGQSSILASAVNVHSPDLITCSFSLISAANGLWDVVVINPDGQRDSLEGGFAVATAPPIEIHSISPQSGPRGVQSLAASITGANFFPTTTVRLEMSWEPDIWATDISVASPESITCVFDLSDADVGFWDVVVENADGQSARLTDGFAVFLPLWIELIDPESWETGETVHITNLKGRNFLQNMTVWLSMDGQPDLNPTNLVVESTRRITMDLDLSAVQPGAWDVIADFGGGSVDTLHDGFTVLPYNLWFPEIYLTTSDYDENLTSCNARSVAVGPGGRVHVVWEDDRHGGLEIYYRQFNGTEWEAEHRLSDTPGSAFAPAVAVDASANVHVVWVCQVSGDWWIYHDMFDGAAWAGNEIISNGIDVGGTSCAVAADRDGSTYVVWLGALGYEWDVFFRMHDGTSWHDEERVTDYWSSKARPSVTCDDSGNVHVAWYDHIDGVAYDSEIYYARCEDSIWSVPERISYGTDVSWTPCVQGGRGEEVHIVWVDRLSGYLEIHYRHHNGTAWEPEMAVTDWSIEAANASVAVDASGTPHVVWRDLRAATEEIYHSLLGEYGWEPTYRLSDPGSYSGNPSVAMDPGGKAHVVWQGYTGGWNIHYRSGYPGVFTGVEDMQAEPEPASALRITPNPVRGSAEIVFSGAWGPVVSAAVYDIKGRLVWEAEFGAGVEGRRAVIWDCVDKDGREVSPGIYFVSVSVGQRVSSGKVVVLK